MIAPRAQRPKDVPQREQAFLAVLVIPAWERENQDLGPEIPSELSLSHFLKHQSPALVLATSQDPIYACGDGNGHFWKNWAQWLHEEGLLKVQVRLGRSWTTLSLVLRAQLAGTVRNFCW